MLSVGTASLAMLSVHAADLTTQCELAISELRSIRGCEAHLASHLLRLHDIEAELVHSMNAVPQPINPTLVAA